MLGIESWRITITMAALTAADLVPKPQRRVARQMIFDGCERAVVALAKALTSDPKRS